MPLILDPGVKQTDENMNKTAWITGATSGFGRATAKRFVEGGWKVVASGRRAERHDALRAELGEANVHACAFDVRDEVAANAAIAALPDDFRDIDLLVNNAGLAQGDRKSVV